MGSGFSRRAVEAVPEVVFQRPQRSRVVRCRTVPGLRSAGINLLVGRVAFATGLADLSDCFAGSRLVLQFYRIHE